MSFMSGIMMGASIGSTLHEAIAGRMGRQQPPVFTGAGRSILTSAGRNALPCTGAAAGRCQVPEFALVSSLAGRRRYRMALLVGNTDLCRYLEEKLGGLSDIRSAKANEATGSLLLEYSGREEDMDSLMEAVRQKLTAADGMVPTGTPAPGEYRRMGRPAPTVYARSWSSTGAFLNGQVRRLTCNSFDISALISLFFLLRGIRKMLVYGQRPSGPSMIWWALHLMKGWRG